MKLKVLMMASAAMFMLLASQGEASAQQQQDASEKTPQSSGIKCTYTILQKRLNFKSQPVQIQIFVNSADFYVNAVMSTARPTVRNVFTIFDFYPTYCGYFPCERTTS